MLCVYPWWFHPTAYHQSAYRQSAYRQSAYRQSAYRQSAYRQSAYRQSVCQRCFVAASVLFSTGDLITSWHRWHLVYLSVVHTCGAVCLDLWMAYKKSAYCHFGHAAGSHLGM